MNNYPTRTDIFNMNSVIDYPRLIKEQAGANKVKASKKSFIKKNNTATKSRIHRMQNK
jgi:hypothetical protein